MFFFCKQKTAYDVRISDWSSDVCSSDLRQPDGCRLEQGHVAGDDAGLLQLAHAPPAGRGRDADRPGEIDVGNAGVLLQHRQDAAVDGVEGRLFGQGRIFPYRGQGRQDIANLSLLRASFARIYIRLGDTILALAALKTTDRKSTRLKYSHLSEHM